MVSERRPHWTDELIEAVRATGDDGEVDYWMPREQVYRIIAAVEDWQAKRLGASAAQLDSLADWQVMKGTIPLWHWAQAEATLQRVREVMMKLNEHAPDPVDSRQVYRALRLALDGGDDG